MHFIFRWFLTQTMIACDRNDVSANLMDKAVEQDCHRTIVVKNSHIELKQTRMVKERPNSPQCQLKLIELLRNKHIFRVNWLKVFTAGYELQKTTARGMTNI